jgi:peroxiredoxin Q/BCP
MRKTKGTQIQAIELQAIDGQLFNTESLSGKPWMLSFFRFAGCPFCNLRMHELVSKYNEFGEDFTIIAIFDSPLDNLQHHAAGHNAPFPILADESNAYYREFGIEHSISGVIKGMLLRFPTLIKAMSSGYIPTTFKGRLTTMPADFLIDRDGRIDYAYYGSDEGDHLAIATVKAFSINNQTKNRQA